MSEFIINHLKIMKISEEEDIGEDINIVETIDEIVDLIEEEAAKFGRRNK